MTLSAWFLLACAVPVLLAGEWLHRRVPFFPRYNIPVPVVGGLTFALLVLAANTSGLTAFSFASKVSAAGWLWLVTPGMDWGEGAAKNVNLPLLVGFFTCVGLAAPVRVLRSGGRALLVLLLAATVIAVIQNAVGVALAAGLGVPPLLGVVCGSLTLVGGHGTALGFASSFEQAGLASAASAAAAAATFGLVAGGLLAGPLAEWLLRRTNPMADGAAWAGQAASTASFFGDLRALGAGGRSALSHALMIAACIKAGAWLGFGLERTGAALPAYMGALLVGLAVRAVHDAMGGTWLRGEVLARWSAVLLALFLAVTLASLNLRELAAIAGPMLVILIVNTGVTLLFAAFVVWPLLGRNHEAGTMVAGLVGFGVGSTATAVAAMDAIVRRRGPAPRATTLVPPTGGFLIDFTNAPVIAAFIRLFS
ncbi:MAG: sodium/glutamate symporter [Opitutaceae bacterium]|nr:sodium/glutamate symporter [Opitutaceae bacterium]